jgi:hypothetical protein
MPRRAQAPPTLSFSSATTDVPCVAQTAEDAEPRRFTLPAPSPRRQDQAQPEAYIKKIKAQLAKLSPPVAQALKVACEGDLTRLSFDKAGGFTVHNRSQADPPKAPKTAPVKRSVDRAALAALFDDDDLAPHAPATPVVQAPRPKPAPTPKKAKKAAPPPPVPKRQPRTRVALEDLAALINFGEVKVTQPAAGVTVVQAPPRPPREDTIRTSPEVDPEVIRNFDWDQVNLDQTVIKLRDLMRNGVPQAIRYTYSDDVLALYGVDMNLLEALRQPERVEIRPESFDKAKRYPVLGFHRGDVTVILGLRQPVTPKVIAAYAHSRRPTPTAWRTPAAAGSAPSVTCPAPTPGRHPGAGAWGDGEVLHWDAVRKRNYCPRRRPAGQGLRRTEISARG